MKQHHSVIFLAALLTVLALSAAPAQAQGQSGSTQTFQFDGGGIFNHPCGTELVECTGTSGVTVRNGENANGIVFFNILFRDQGIECVGLDSGNVYRSAFAQHITERNINPFPDSCLDSGCTATLTVTWHLISQGSAANLRSRSLAQFTFTGQGEPINVNFTETTLSCD
jgi:hypothetical protein